MLNVRRPKNPDLENVVVVPRYAPRLIPRRNFPYTRPLNSFKACRDDITEVELTPADFLFIDQKEHLHDCPPNFEFHPVAKRNIRLTKSLENPIPRPSRN